MVAQLLSTTISIEVEKRTRPVEIQVKIPNKVGNKENNLFRNKLRDGERIDGEDMAIDETL